MSVASARIELWNALKTAGWKYFDALALLALIKARRADWTEDGSLLSEEAKVMK